jgi:hypothetical protein
MIAPSVETGKSATVLYRKGRSFFTLYGCGSAAL